MKNHELFAAHAVTALCWQPNGKVLAAGQEDGGVVLYDVEVRSVQHCVYGTRPIVFECSFRHVNGSTYTHWNLSTVTQTNF